jgi:putative aminopeptidase FrvX
VPKPHIETDAMIRLLVDLLNIPSPTGYHIEVIPAARRAFDDLAIPGLTSSLTPKGALMLEWEGEADDHPRGLTAHLDTLGLMVKAIKPDGRLTVTNLGGIHWGQIEAENVTIRTHGDRRYRGTVLPVNPSSHVNRDVHKQARDAEHMEVRIDERTASRAETEALGIGVGDFVFLDPRVEVLASGFIRARFLDDKASVAAIYGALKALAQAGKRPAQRTAILLANYEEVGHGGAAGWPMPLAELLAVDMAAIGEGQASDEYACTLCVKDSSGPYHFAMNEKLRRIAGAAGVDLKVDIYPYYSSDGAAYWRAGGEAPVGLIGPGVASSHGYERTHVDALAATARLIAAYLLDAESAAHA